MTDTYKKVRYLSLDGDWIRFTERNPSGAPPYTPYPGRPHKATLFLPHINYLRAALPFTEKELSDLLMGLGTSEHQLRTMLQAGRLPSYPSGGYNHPHYTRWKNYRTYHKKSNNSVCLRWLVSFRHFCLDIGRPDEDMSLEEVNRLYILKRLHTKRPWGPTNVKWEARG